VTCADEISRKGTVPATWFDGAVGSPAMDEAMTMSPGDDDVVAKALRLRRN
jgi:hypothetical protein